MKLKRLAALCMASVMAFSLTACGNSEGGAGTNTGTAEDTRTNVSNGETKSQAEGGQVEDGQNKEPENSGQDGGAGDEDLADIEVMFWTLNTIPSDLETVEDAINAITEEKINTTVHLNIIEMGSYTQQLNLMMSGSEKLDLMVTLPGDSAHFNSMTSQNQLTDLTDLLTEYAPQLLETVPESWIDGTSINGRIYSVPSYGDKATPLCFICRKDVLDETGIDPDSVKNADDLDALFAKVKELHPDMTPVAIGSQKIIMTPYSLNSDGEFIKYEGLGEGDNSIISIMGNEGSEILNYYETDEYKATIERMKEWYDKGYLYKDGSTYDEMAETLILAGNYFGTFKMQAVGTEASSSATCGHEMYFIQLDDSPVIDTVALRKFTWAVPVTATEPEAAVKFMNLLYTDAEVLNLVTWGVEGVHYQTLEDGSIDFMDGQDANNCGYYLGDCTAIFGNGFLAKVRKGQDADLREKSKELNLSAQVSRFNGFSFDTAGLENEVAGLTNTVEQYRPALACGLYTEDYYQEFLQKLKDNGVEKYLDTIQEQLDAWSKESN